VAEAEADEHHAQRLAQGKVYIPAQAARALQNFFRKDNLVSGRPCGST
jgi:K+-sensing histidine kinase KdpD